MPILQHIVLSCYNATLYYDDKVCIFSPIADIYSSRKTVIAMKKMLPDRGSNFEGFSYFLLLYRLLLLPLKRVDILGYPGKTTPFLYI